MGMMVGKAMLVLCLVVLFNLAVAFCNARFCGKIWDEANEVRGWGKAVVWSGAILSAVGFSSVYVVVLAMLIGGGAAKAATALWYLAAIVPALGTGLVVLAHSWRVAYQTRGLGDLGVSVYNSIAEARELYGSLSGVSEASDVVRGFFDEEGDSDAASRFIVGFGFVVVFGLSFGATWTIIQSYRGTTALPALAGAG
jgi:hypothetical protein